MATPVHERGPALVDRAAPARAGLGGWLVGTMVTSFVTAAVAGFWSRRKD